MAGDEGYDQEWLAVEEVLGTRPVMTGDQAQDIAVYNIMGEQLAAEWPKNEEGLEVTNETIEPHNMRVRIYKPKGTGEGMPIMVYFHGGGYLAGNLDTEDPHCRIFAREVPCLVVSVEYPLSPAGFDINQIIDAGVEAVKWTLANAPRFNIATSAAKCLVTGGSAGASLALQVAYDFIRRGNTATVAGLVLLNPVVGPPDWDGGKYKDIRTSYVENAEGAPLMTKKVLEGMWSTNKANMTSPKHFPLLAYADEFPNFPPTYIATADKDPARDDGTVLEAVLKNAGVRVKLDNYKGFPHYFHIFSHVPTAHTCMQNAVEGARFVLGV